jgi:hypothetical protein
MQIAVISRWVADAWDNVPITVETAARIEALLKPELERLVNLADGDDRSVSAGIDSLAVAFGRAIRSGLD